jgi:hypothetical protein
MALRLLVAAPADYSTLEPMAVDFKIDDPEPRTERELLALRTLLADPHAGTVFFIVGLQVRDPAQCQTLCTTKCSTTVLRRDHGQRGHMHDVVDRAVALEHRHRPAMPSSTGPTAGTPPSSRISL